MAMTLVLDVAITMMLATSMLLAGLGLGERRTLRSLAKLIDEGRFELRAADGRRAASRDLLHAMNATVEGPRTIVSKSVIAIALFAACIGLAVAFVAVSQSAP